MGFWKWTGLAVWLTFLVSTGLIFIPIFCWGWQMAKRRPDDNSFVGFVWF